VTRPIFTLRGFKRPRQATAAAFGALEREGMEIARRRGEVSARDLSREFEERVAYTTLVTTLNRLSLRKLSAFCRRLNRQTLVKASGRKPPYHGGECRDPTAFFRCGLPRGRTFDPLPNRADPGRALPAGAGAWPSNPVAAG